jgi:hypothetical protein
MSSSGDSVTTCRRFSRGCRSSGTKTRDLSEQYRETRRKPICFFIELCFKSILHFNNREDLSNFALVQMTRRVNIENLPWFVFIPVSHLLIVVFGFLLE